MITTLSSNEEEIFQIFFEQNFEYKEGEKLDASDLRDLFVEEVSKDNRELSNFKRYLKVKKIEYRRDKGRGSGYYVNCSLKRRKDSILERLRSVQEDKPKIERRAAK
jgi:hypothetical protein